MLQRALQRVIRKSEYKGLREAATQLGMLAANIRIQYPFFFLTFFLIRREGGELELIRPLLSDLHEEARNSRRRPSRVSQLTQLAKSEGKKIYIYILSTARRGRETVVNSRSDAWTTTRNIARAHACFCIALDHGRERNQHPWSVRMRHVGIRTYDLPGIFKNSRKDVVGKTARPPQHYNSGCLVMQLIATFSMLVGTFR